MTPSPRKVFLRGFIYGTSLLGLMLLYEQDMIGMDRLVQLTQEHWVDSRITAPIEIVLLATTLVMFVRTFTQLPANRKEP